MPEARRPALRRSARRLRRDTALGWQGASHPSLLASGSPAAGRRRPGRRPAAGC